MKGHALPWREKADRRHTIGAPLTTPRPTDGPPSPLVFDDVVVSPYTELHSVSGGRDHQGGPRWPSWEKQLEARHCRRARPVDDEPLILEPQEHLSGEAAWGGAIVQHFGHQIADYSMRLLSTVWSLPGIPVLFASHEAYRIHSLRDAPRYWWSIIDWFGLGPRTVRFVDTPTSIAHLAVLPQAEQLGGPGPGTWYLDRLDEIVEQRLGRVRQQGACFVSRATEGARLAGEGYLEKAMAAAGVTILRPGYMPLTEQLAAYMSTRILIATSGSALHAMQLLGRNLGDVVVINRVPQSGVAIESMRPRVRSLNLIDAGVELVHGRRPDGHPQLAMGISILDLDTLVARLRTVLPGIERQIERAAFVRAQEDDVIAWLATLDARWTRPAGSVDHLLETLAASRMSHLVPVARRALVASERGYRRGARSPGTA